MYMSTRANLDYWSTDNCCLRWSLRTGAIIIGFFSMVWQSLMVMSGVMMLVQCPVPTDNTTNITIITIDTINTTTTTNLTLGGDPLPLDPAVDGPGAVTEMHIIQLDEDDIEDNDRNVKCLSKGSSSSSSSGIGGDSLEDNSNSRGNSSGFSGNSNNSSTITTTNNNNSTNESNNTTRKVLINCPWLPDPETEVLEVYTKEKLFLVAGIFIAYSGIYCILSLCVIVGAFTSSVTLLQGWVAFTGFHNMLILASLLVPLPFTTLLHLFLSIAYFILSLYTWAVVKSYMHALKVELNKPLLPEGSITDYTVDGVDVTEIPVQV